MSDIAETQQPGTDPLCRSCGGACWTTLYRAPAFDATDTTFFALDRCEQCGLVQTQPRLTRQELGRYYAPSYYGSGQRKFASMVEWFTRYDNRRRSRRLLSLLHAYLPAEEKVARRILDIGCGRANLLAALAQQGCECHGVERQEFPLDEAQPGIRFYRDALENLPLATEYFDAIVLWHVLEHVENPASIVGIVARLLRPGGILALAVPNFGSWQSALFKSDWFHLDLPRHTHHFTPPVLQQLLKNNAFHLLRTSTWAFDQNVFGFIQSLLNKLSPPRSANALYNLLKSPRSWKEKIRLSGWLIAAGIIAPLAFAEYLLAGWCGRGASLIVYAQKQSGRSIKLAQ